MTNIFNKAALAATVAAVAFATPAFASPTSVSANGTATVKIFSPLTIAAPSATDSVVDFGILVGTLGGASARTANAFVINAASAPTAGTVCTGAINWTCSGSPHRALYTITGSADSSVNVWVSAGTIDLNRAGGILGNVDDTIPLTLALSALTDSNGDGTADVLLSAGTANVYVGGSLAVSSTDRDGVYTGTFTVNADYQ
ncbi:MAG: DUF4402 domain-containing protein [Sphingomicrobium sp.]